MELAILNTSGKETGRKVNLNDQFSVLNLTTMLFTSIQNSFLQIKDRVLIKPKNVVR